LFFSTWTCSVSCISILPIFASPSCGKENLDTTTSNFQLTWPVKILFFLSLFPFLASQSLHFSFFFLSPNRNW
jgi:hypothetical protein